MESFKFILLGGIFNIVGCILNIIAVILKSSIGETKAFMLLIPAGVFVGISLILIIIGFVNLIKNK